MNPIQHLKLWQKFGLLGLLALGLLLPIAGMLVHRDWQEHDFTRRELEGVAPLGQLLKLVRETQVHRGLTANALSGNTEAAQRRVQQQQKVQAAVQAAMAGLAGYDDPASRARREAMDSAWKSLVDDLAAGKLDAPSSFARHTAMVKLQLRLLTDVTDASGLILDPAPGSYHLVALLSESLPQITERLGQSRAQGAIAIKLAALSPERRMLLQGNNAQLEQLAESFRRHLDQAFQHDPEQAAILGPLRREAEQALATAMRTVQEQLLQPAQPGGNPQAYFDAMTALIDAQFKLSDAAFARLQSELVERLDRSTRNLALTAGLLLLAIVGGLGLGLAITRATARSRAAAQQALAALARGELDHEVQCSARDEFGQTARELGQAMRQLAALIGQVKLAGGELAAASVQIAGGNADLSSRTERSASSLQQAASSLEEITATMQSSAEAARQATQSATESSEVALAGGQLIGQLVETMNRISQSSQRIADIISVIDGIAFQTNILALNAAVEAARAGEAGRGFAVVASEVRALAQRSAQAAREIKGLIGESVGTVEGGARLVGEARQTMDSIVQKAREVSELIAGIDHATAEQARGLALVNQAVGQLDQGTQQNAALVEESAAAAESLRDQADRLLALVGRFRVAQAA